MAFGVMGRRSYGLSELWPVGVMGRRNKDTHTELPEKIAQGQNRPDIIAQTK